MTTRGAFLCADIGTSSIKAGFVAPDGILIAGTRIPYTSSEAPSLPAAAWEEGFYRALRRLYEKAPGTAVLAISISGNGPTLVPLAQDGRAFAPLHWHEAVELRWRGIGGPSLFLPAVSQYFEERAADAAATRLLVSSQEWLSMRLGADPFTCLATESYATWYWNLKQIAARGLEPKLFPPCVLAGSIVGQLSAAARSACAIAPGSPDSIPIVASGPDFMMAILGTACVDEGLACDRAGSSEGLNYCCSSERADTLHLGKKGLRVLPHWNGAHSNASAILPPTGARFEEFRRSSGQGGRRYRDILADIDAAGSCTGPVCNPLAAAGRALVEGLGYAVREGIDRLEDAGLPVASLRLSGGQARNDTWNQLKADILDKPLVAGAIRDAELAGSAALCLVALGEAASPAEAARRLWREERIFEPGSARAAYYRERRAERQAAQALRAGNTP